MNLFIATQHIYFHCHQFSVRGRISNMWNTCARRESGFCINGRIIVDSREYSRRLGELKPAFSRSHDCSTRRVSGRCVARIATRVVASSATISGSFLSNRSDVRRSLEDRQKPGPSSESYHEFLCEEQHPRS